MRACRYDSASEGVYGSGVLCEAHNDVGFLTFDPRAATPGLHALRRADNLWVPVEEAPPLLPPPRPASLTGGVSHAAALTRWPSPMLDATLRITALHVPSLLSRLLLASNAMSG